MLAFWALRNFETNFLAFLKGFETVHVDCRKVCKQIFAAIIRSDETETFCIIEPFNCTSCHVTTSFFKKREKLPQNYLI